MELGGGGLEPGQRLELSDLLAELVVALDERAAQRLIVMKAIRLRRQLRGEPHVGYDERDRQRDEKTHPHRLIEPDFVAPRLADDARPRS